MQRKMESKVIVATLMLALIVQFSDTSSEFNAGPTDDHCGEELIPQERVHNTDKSSSAVRRGEFPWNAVIMTGNALNSQKWDYLCGGTLISSEFIVTGAACIHSKGSPNNIKAEDMKVLLGAYNISDITEEHRKEFDVASIIIHGGWDPEDVKYAHDIALLKLMDEVKEITPTIHPICLKKTSDILDIQNGVLAGYGQFNELTVTSDIPLKVELQIINHEIWIEKQWELIQNYWDRSFVAGSETGGVCPGDSGAGFYVKSNDKFYLRGFASIAVLGEGYNCTHNNYVIFTDVLQYLDDFILPILNPETTQ